MPALEKIKKNLNVACRNKEHTHTHKKKKKKKKNGDSVLLNIFICSD